MCGVTIASCAATATEMPVFHAWGTTSRSCSAAIARHAPRLGQSPDAPDVGLRDVHAASLDQGRELEARRQPLALGDPHRRAARELGVAGEVVDPERRLEEEDVVAARSPRRARERALDVVEGVLHVDHQGHLGPGRLAHRAHDLDDPLVGPVQPLVRVRPVERRLELRGA